MDFSHFCTPFINENIHHISNYSSYPFITFFYPQIDEDHSNLKTNIPEVKLEQPGKEDLGVMGRVEAALKQLHEQGVVHKKTHWSLEEDRLLERLVQVQKLEWKEVSQHFDGRTQNMCYSRYRRISISGEEKIWRREDERMVTQLVQKLGEKWKLISQRLPKYSPKQIRERYLNFLRPNISKGDFTFEEDLQICSYVLSQGKHWRQMEQVLPKRPEGAIKGRFYSKLQKIILDASS